MNPAAPSEARARLDAIVKAYDVRGLVGTQLTERGRRGARAPASSTRSAPPGARSSSATTCATRRPAFAAAFARGADAPRRRRRRHRPLLDRRDATSPPGSLDAPAAMFTASHNPATYNGIKFCRAGAQGISLDTGPRRDPRPRAATTSTHGITPCRDAGHRAASATCWPTTRRTCAPSSTSSGIRPLQGRRRCRQRHGRPHGARRARHGRRAARRCRSRSSRSTSSSTAPSPTTRRTRSSPRTSSTCRRRSSSTAPTSASPSTATPTAASSSTSTGGAVTPSRGRRDRRPARDRARARRRRDGEIVVHPQPHHLAHRARDDRGGRGDRRCAPASGTRSSRTGCARPAPIFGGEHSAHYYFRDFWGADNGMLAAMHLLAEFGAQDAPLSRARGASSRPTRCQRRDQLDRRRRAGGLHAHRRGVHRPRRVRRARRAHRHGHHRRGRAVLVVQRAPLEHRAAAAAQRRGRRRRRRWSASATRCSRSSAA